MDNGDASDCDNLITRYIGEIINDNIRGDMEYVVSIRGIDKGSVTGCAAWQCLINGVFGAKYGINRTRQLGIW